MSTHAIRFAHVVSRNIGPLAGIVLLGWDADVVLVLYCVDTVLAMIVIFGGLAGAYLPSGQSSRRRAFAKGAGVVIPVMIVLTAVTLPYVVGNDFDWRAVLDDPALRIGVLWQAIAALWSCRELVGALRASTPERLQLERRFGYVLGRWLTLTFLVFLGLADRFGSAGGAVLVAAYLLLSIWSDVAPHHFMADGADGNGGKRSRDAPSMTAGADSTRRQRRKR